MARRLKSDKPALKQIENWGNADEYIRQIGDLTMKITAAQHKAADDINKAKAELEGKVKPLQQEINIHVRSLEAFATTNKNDFRKERSKKLNFGLLGWRKSTSVAIKKTTLEKIKEIFSKAKAAMCIITKETVSKEALAKLTDEELASVGARREIKDDFFVEPDLPKAVDYCE
jgi:phage host-nuclease inhibitor protein Gam